MFNSIKAKIRLIVFDLLEREAEILNSKYKNLETNYNDLLNVLTVETRGESLNYGDFVYYENRIQTVIEGDWIEEGSTSKLGRKMLTYGTGKYTKCVASRRIYKKINRINHNDFETLNNDLKGYINNRIDHTTSKAQRENEELKNKLVAFFQTAGTEVFGDELKFGNIIYYNGTIHEIVESEYTVGKNRHGNKCIKLNGDSTEMIANRKKYNKLK